MEKSRVVFELYLLANAHGPIRSFDLAKQVNISLRTFKSDVDALKKLAISSGATLESKKGLGYWIEIHQQNIFDKVKMQLDILYSRENRFTLFASRRTADILRMILGSPTHLKIEEISDKLYLSKSAIRQDLALSRDFLASYQLELISKKGIGIQVIGEEMFFRLCMVELLETHIDTAEHHYEQWQYSHYFTIDHEVKKLIRRYFLDVLRDHGYLVLDKFINRMIQYYILTINRMQDGFSLNLSAQMKEDLHHFSAFPIAKTIIEKLNTIPYVHFEEDEVEFTTLLLVCWSDGIDFTLLDHPRLYQEIEQFVQQETANIYTKIDSVIEIEKNELAMMIRPVLIRIGIQKHFGLHQLMYFDRILGGTSLLYAYIPKLLAEICMNCLEDDLGCSLSAMFTTQFAIRFLQYMESITFDYQPVKLAICSRNGMLGADVIKKQILHRYHTHWFSKLDIYDYFQMRRFTKEDYDYILLNFPEYSYRYTLPHMHVSQIMTQQQIQDLYEKVMIKGYQIHAIFEQLSLDHAFIFKDVKTESEKTLLQQIAMHQGQNSQQVSKLYQQIVQDSEYTTIENTLIILNTRSQVNQGMICVYRIENTMMYRQTHIHDVIYIQTLKRIKKQESKYIHNMIYQFTRYPGWLNKLMDTQDYGLFDEAVYRCLING